MRKLNPFLSCAIFSLSSIALARLEAQTLFRARGLKNGFCYQQPVAISCARACALLLFPNSQAQLSLNIRDTPPAARKAMGHFFSADFRVINDDANEVELQSWKPITAARAKELIQASSGLLVPSACAK